MTRAEGEEGKVMPRAGEEEQRLYKVENWAKETDMPLWSGVCALATLTAVLTKAWSIAIPFTLGLSISFALLEVELMLQYKI